MLGAIGPDHTNVRMTMKDTMRYYSNDSEKMAMLAMIGGSSG